MNNNIIIVGHVGQEPVVKTFSSGTKVAKFSVAVHEYHDFSGNGQDQVMWVDVQAWNQTADWVISWITKGCEVLVQGRLALDKYTNSKGQEITKPVINMLGFHLCGLRPAKAKIDRKLKKNS